MTSLIGSLYAGSVPNRYRLNSCLAEKYRPRPLFVEIVVVLKVLNIILGLTTCSCTGVQRSAFRSNNNLRTVWFDCIGIGLWIKSKTASRGHRLFAAYQLHSCSVGAAGTLRSYTLLRWSLLQIGPLIVGVYWLFLTCGTSTLESSNF